MGNNKILRELISYKKTCALMAAFDLGIYEILLSNPISLIELTGKLCADKVVLECFLEYMRAEGIMEEKDGLWSLTNDFSCSVKDFNTYRNIVEYEKGIYKRWLTPKKIADSVKDGIGYRDFDCDGFSSEDKKIYCRAMYGNNLNLIAFHIRRELQGRNTMDCLEYGRSMGELSIALQRMIPELSVTLAIDKSFSSILEQSIIPRFTQKPKAILNMDDFVVDTTFDLICLMNTIHYYEKDQTLDLLVRLKQSMKSDARLCICDLFYDKGDTLKSSWILDWITHGGINTLTAVEVLDLLKKAGFRDITHKYIDGISTDIFFAY